MSLVCRAILSFSPPPLSLSSSGFFLLCGGCERVRHDPRRLRSSPSSSTATWRARRGWEGRGEQDECADGASALSLCATWPSSWFCGCAAADSAAPKWRLGREITTFGYFELDFQGALALFTYKRLYKKRLRASLRRLAVSPGASGRPGRSSGRRKRGAAGSLSLSDSPTTEIFVPAQELSPREEREETGGGGAAAANKGQGGEKLSRTPLIRNKVNKSINYVLVVCCDNVKV